jgi:hypothetical protein
MMSMVRGDTIDSGEYLYVGTLSASDGGTMIPESPWCVDKRRGLMMIVQCGCTVTRCVCVCVCASHDEGRLIIKYGAEWKRWPAAG